MYDVTKLVPLLVFNELLRILPTPRQQVEGRRRCTKVALLNGVLQFLVNGVAWNKIADCGCSYASCYRYFKELQRLGILKLVYETLADGKTNISEGAIDTTKPTLSILREWSAGTDTITKMELRFPYFLIKLVYQLM